MPHTLLHLQVYALQTDKLVTPGHLATKLTLCLKSDSINVEKQVLSSSCWSRIKTDSQLFNRVQNIIRLFLSMFLTPPPCYTGVWASVCVKNISFLFPCNVAPTEGFDRFTVTHVF